ncbi:hypothetical protein AGQ63_23865 [Salmonella enterica subsp. enterica]|nr:hypothetical protein AGQ63_23865 [Salmonella enterica subsp. enterica]
MKEETQRAINNIELGTDSAKPDDNLTTNVRPQSHSTVPTDVNAVPLSIDGGKTWVNATHCATPVVWDYTQLTYVSNVPHSLIHEVPDAAGYIPTQYP